MYHYLPTVQHLCLRTLGPARKHQGMTHDRLEYIQIEFKYDITSEECWRGYLATHAMWACLLPVDSFQIFGVRPFRTSFQQTNRDSSVQKRENSSRGNIYYFKRTKWRYSAAIEGIRVDTALQLKWNIWNARVGKKFLSNLSIDYCKALLTIYFVYRFGTLHSRVEWWLLAHLATADKITWQNIFNYLKHRQLLLCRNTRLLENRPIFIDRFNFNLFLPNLLLFFYWYFIDLLKSAGVIQKQNTQWTLTVLETCQ